jgi:hypothetical protein
MKDKLVSSEEDDQHGVNLTQLDMSTLTTNYVEN